MLFNSISFAIFLPIVFGVYWSISHKYRWIILLLSSYYFYMSWNAKYIVLIIFTTCVSYFSALLLKKFESKKKILLAVTLMAALGTLFFFKYFNFMAESITKVSNLFAIPLHPFTLKLMLPVGISFYTFQTLSYVIDVYRGKVQPEHHFGKYAVFISFFPQLVAGPIERTENLLPQICKEHEFNYNQAVYGAKLMAWGYFKKIVIADNLAVFVDLIYNNVYAYKGFSLIAAIGTAKLFGIDLMNNFRSPYFSASIKEFWSRWHISLSTWFRDYVYITLGGNRKGRKKKYRNQILTFLVSGLWHGANWTFVLWGGVHGILQVTEDVLQVKISKRQEKVWKHFCSMGLVFTLVCLCWIFFRTETVGQSFYVLRHMLDGIIDIQEYILTGYRDLQLSRVKVFRIGIPFVILLIYDYVSLKEDPILFMGRFPGWVRWMIYYLLIFLIILIGNFGNTQFVYFQF